MTLEIVDTVMSVADAARILKCGRSTVYELIRRGELPAKRLGRARGVRIPTKAFYAWLDSPDNALDNPESKGGLYGDETANEGRRRAA